MSYSAFFLATHWGRMHGGINVLNQDLARALAVEINPVGKCYCVVETMGRDDIDSNVVVETCENFGSAQSVAELIHGKLTAGDDLHSDIVIIGHDVHTGFLAIDAAKKLRELQVAKVRSAVIRHMHYRHYDLFKGSAPDEREEKRTRQRDLVDKADIVFAVGPLLADSAYGSEATQASVKMLIPGVPPIEPDVQNPEPSWQIFMSGRLGSDDDRIKNARLAVAGLAKAYDRAKVVGEVSFRNRGCLTLFGAETSEIKSTDVPSNFGGEHFLLNAKAYTDDTEVIFESLRRSHFALMPSWHEGFGLSGWEAICAGVPLICSSHSGLYQFLDMHIWKTEAPPRSDGVVAVALSGNDEQDVEALSTAIFDVTRDYKLRKQGALELALYLRGRYTWSSCAKSVAEAFEWPLATSDDWEARQAVAKTAVLDKDAEEALIGEARAVLDKGSIYTEWQIVCTALANLSVRGKVQHGTVGIEARTYLSKLSDSLEKALVQKPPTLPPLRSSGELDVTWRFLAAASSVSGTLSDFVHLIKHNLWRQICSDGFLLREFYFYYCRFAADFRSHDEEVTSRISDLRSRGLESKDFQVRLARLALKYPSLLTSLQEMGYETEFPQAALTIKAFEAHQSIVSNVPPEHFATFLWLASERALGDSYTPDFTLDFIREALGKEILPQRWRGDKRFPVAAMLSALPEEKALAVLKAFSTDEDESIRWACLDIAFSRSFRARMERYYRKSQHASGKELTRYLGEIVDAAVSYDGAHPWLQREFLRLFLDEVKNGAHDQPTPFHLNDFPQSRELLGASIHKPLDQSPLILHPEVEAVRKAATARIKRILLVLPPIQLDSGAERKNASRTTTPPLGLGLVASALGRAGHFVEIADCHRFPALTDELVERAAHFDWVGFNVVLSTTKSAQQLVADIKKRSPEALIAIGGPAANLGVWQTSISGAAGDDWDFVVRGNAEQNFVDLVGLTERAGAWPEIEGVSANPNNHRLLKLHCEHWHFQKDIRSIGKALPDAWEPEALLDRRIFRGPNGVYEPGPTRKKNQSYKEAHVVMSRGCEWNCVFCTERVDLSGGERRRSTQSVLQELEALSLEHHHLRIQFIDDNLLPQIAARRADDEMAVTRDVVWSKQFLSGLVKLRQNVTGDFGWRGIFRMEDFVEYEKHLPDFITLLVQSGCGMLAFGIEHGDELRRKKLKANTTFTALSNDEVCALISRLKAAGIRTKGYFILGGQHDNVGAARETIAFALKSGVSLAYFAIYKEFVRAATKLQGSSLIDPQEVESFLSYKELSQDLDGVFLREEALSDHGVGSRLEDRSAIYRALQHLGFSFADLVKYNDYHSDEGPAAPLMERNAFNDRDAYFETLKDAYLSFYLRKDFVSEYEGLVANGY